MSTNSTSTTRTLSLTFLALAVVGGVMLYNAVSNPQPVRDEAAAAAAPAAPSPPASRLRGSSLGAQIACRGLVRGRLKAPATADFSGGDARVLDDSVTWIATGAVDSENSFGAKLRRRYVCQLRYDAARDSWAAEDVRLLE